MKQIRFISMALCLMLLLAVFAAADAEPTTIAAFSFDNVGAIAEEGLKDNGYGDKDTGYLATTGEGLLFASVDGDSYRKLEWSKDDYSGLGLQPAMTGGNYHPWGDGAYLEVQISTVGYADITFRQSSAAPKRDRGITHCSTALTVSTIPILPLMPLRITR